jgi:hypothetical protein
VGTQFQESVMKVNLVAASPQYGTAQVVMLKDPWCAGPGFKGVGMAAQEVFQSLIEEKSKYKARE